ncbi:MAG: hypothetical protein ACK42E_03335, partial [Candidatus Bipolaricaulaceae bacterium]
MGRALGVLGLLLGLALGQGLEVGLRGGGGVGVAYLRLEGVWTLEGVRLGLALAGTGLQQQDHVRPGQQV